MTTPSTRQRGAALLLAMLVLTLVATLASAAQWQQWRAGEIEAADRQRAQAGWVLIGALDWARLILIEDARGNQRGNADHLGEPWAMPLEEARLSSFLAADRSARSDDTLQAFLSGEISDQQARLNFLNLVRVSGSGAAAKVTISALDLQAFTRLYEQLDLPQTELDAAVAELQRSTQRGLQDLVPGPDALAPGKLAHLSWLGISATSLAALQAHVTLLPEPTRLNLNTASATALMASAPGLEQAQAQRLIQARAREPFLSVADANRLLGTQPPPFSDPLHGTRSQYFEVRGRLRLDDTVIEERSLVRRDGLQVRVLWRERLAGS
ncbi:type II secretion system minor pseudopilin GspK [Hydrogenophaga sp.]|uniref:type II secretion system minor pseudopilin GspK n=1 Tax=Hydrogenophaga sp. TaxID=1904254 RepID=UPI0019A435FE|nr:type II secretion system minor pseudopilin GspK [Hydrogenophaga sp.]MBD3892620.1 general secretion pathway protein GspK [Hydrogenophaga sp.]